ncbi:MAG: SAF domain-containing protein, partial [Gordonia sp. (in: high G+C Gram-positive bacteria)]|uniref:SAF domain-containing protein n=1 Tax=Gordonia sp. (in: high G+C Gram-positive bacteria) TaxID=84139 RepID=UPI003BB4C659
LITGQLFTRKPAALRAATVRRTIAALLVVLAGGLLLVERGRHSPDLAVVAARDLRPGSVVTGDDVQVTALPAGSAFPGTLRSVDDVVGNRLTGAVTKGEVLTDTRLLTSRLPTALTGDRSARLVPVRPADPAVAGLLRSGDVVDVLDDESGVLARDAVVAVPADSATPALLALGEAPAHRVAAASLRKSLTLVLH